MVLARGDTMFEPTNVTELSLDWSGDPYGRYRWAE